MVEISGITGRLIKAPIKGGENFDFSVESIFRFHQRKQLNSRVRLESFIPTRRGHCETTARSSDGHLRTTH